MLYMSLYKRYFVIGSVQRIGIDKDNFGFVIIAVHSDFQHCLVTCLRSVEINEVSKVTAVFLVSNITTFYKKL